VRNPAGDDAIREIVEAQRHFVPFLHDDQASLSEFGCVRGGCAQTSRKRRLNWIVDGGALVEHSRRRLTLRHLPRSRRGSDGDGDDGNEDEGVRPGCCHRD